MRELAMPFAVGTLCGSRAMLGPAFAGRDVVSRGVHRAILAVAAAELIADKSERIGNRTDMLPLTARLATGALSATAYHPRRGGRAALAGGLGALAGSFAWFHFRRAVTSRFGISGAAAGLVEDAAGVGLGILLFGIRRRM